MHFKRLKGASFPCESATTILQDSSQDRLELEALRQEALSSLVKVVYIESALTSHSIFLRRRKRVGIQASQKAWDVEG